MYKTVLLFFLSIPFFSFSQDTNSFRSEFITVLNPKYGKELMKQCSRPVPKKAKKFSLVSQPSVDTLEANFKKVQSLVSTTCCYSMGKIRNLADYGFQLIGVSINGKSYIYINAFLKGDINLLPTWKTEPVIMCDGGEGFWGALFDPETKEFSQLSFNGRM